ncbi:hypothetical protein J6590_027946 [Homalodisca vitripennis]|nr:hypothetical protein J6590_027946 [Homalodisca vitripennis]
MTPREWDIPYLCGIKEGTGSFLEVISQCRGQKGRPPALIVPFVGTGLDFIGLLARLITGTGYRLVHRLGHGKTTVREGEETLVCLCLPSAEDLITPRQQSRYSRRPRCPRRISRNRPLLSNCCLLCPVRIPCSVIISADNKMVGAPVPAWASRPHKKDRRRSSRITHRPSHKGLDGFPRIPLFEVQSPSEREKTQNLEYWQSDCQSASGVSDERMRCDSAGPDYKLTYCQGLSLLSPQQSAVPMPCCCTTPGLARVIRVICHHCGSKPGRVRCYHVPGLHHVTVISLLPQGQTNCSVRVQHSDLPCRFRFLIAKDMDVASGQQARRANTGGRSVGNNSHWIKYSILYRLVVLDYREVLA